MNKVYELKKKTFVKSMTDENTQLRKQHRPQTKESRYAFFFFFEKTIKTKVEDIYYYLLISPVLSSFQN